ncbi:MAG: hypothetical protein CVT90_00225 [Candidatus Altiarchaeales archaeon HGW-Altiarchaeales-3]|nr:MAG: hypothetical protein CVT90_00225 [Candidatus Altiarchaeales archaeon HGW-Altiarchaeales-3]
MTLLNRNNYIIFKLNLEKNMVDIDVGHENKYKYILKEERGKINILNVKIGDVIKITRKSPTTRESFYYREVIES